MLLDDDHAELDGLIEEALAALDCGDLGRSHARLDLFWARLAMHIRAEHLHLFPAILRAVEGRQGERPSAAEARERIEELRHDHDFFMRELAAAMKLLRTLARDEKESLVEARAHVLAVRERLVAHNRTEEGQVYRWAETLLTPAERRVLTTRMQRELENLPPRFADTT